jgi:hypothetical protein
MSTLTTDTRYELAELLGAAGQAPARAPQPQAHPRTVRGTTSADSVGLQLLIGEGSGLPSALDVDPRLLTVRRFPAPAQTPVRRTLDAPANPQAEERAMVRRRLMVASGVVLGTVAAGLSVVQALA